MKGRIKQRQSGRPEEAQTVDTSRADLARANADLDRAKVESEVDLRARGAAVSAAELNVRKRKGKLWSGRNRYC